MRREPRSQQRARNIAEFVYECKADRRIVKKILVKERVIGICILRYLPEILRASLNHAYCEDQRPLFKRATRG